MSDQNSKKMAPVFEYSRIRLEMSSLKDPVEVDDRTSQLEDIRSKHFAVSILAAFWDIQVRYPALIPLIAFSVVLKVFF